MSRHDSDYETDEEILEDDGPTRPAPQAKGAPGSGSAARRPPRPVAAPPPRRDPTQSRRSAGGPSHRPPTRAVAARPAPRNWLVLGGLGALALVVIVGGGLAFSGILKGNGANAVVYPTPDRTVFTGTPNYTPPPDNIAARVDGQPITGAQWTRRFATDQAQFLSDPLFAMVANNFEGITGTRMLDQVYHDSLDKLINFQVIQLEAQKEGLLPKADEQQQIIDQGKQHDLQNGQTFEQFLQQKGITEQEYKTTIVNNVIYAAMAQKHTPTTGSADERTNAFLAWMCGVRQNHKVEIFVTFMVDNPACTSGLPSDIPIPGLPTPQELPAAAVTGGVAPVPTSGAAPVPTPVPSPAGTPNS